MQEIIEFRMIETDAQKYLPDDVGVPIGKSNFVRKVVIDTNDPLMTEIGKIDRKRRAEGDIFFTSWEIRRKYSDLELANAALLKLVVKKVFEPSGEECGTKYDDKSACPECGSGAKQITPLFLNGRRLPKKVDFAKTIADEVIVSRRVVDVFQSSGATGAKFESVSLANAIGEKSDDWYQPIVQAAPVEMHSNTRFGSNPFDNEQYGRCPRADLLGLNILSEVWVQEHSFDQSDIVCTRQFNGVRRGLLRPERSLLISNRLWRLFQRHGISGHEVEVVHFV